MAVASVKLRSMRGSESKPSTRKKFKQSVWEYVVLTDAITDTEQTVLADGRIPKVYSPHNTQGDMLVVDRSVELVTPYQNAGTHGQQWRVYVTFSDDVPCDPDDPDDPIDDPQELSWSTSRFQRPVEKDRDDKAILNGAGDPFEPAIEVDDAHDVLTVVRNEPFNDYTLSFARIYKNKINSAEFFGYPIGEAKCQDISATRQILGCDFFWRITYVFEFRKGGWQPNVLQQGFRYLESPANAFGQSSSSPKTATDELKQPFNTQVLIKNDGTILAPGEEPEFKTFNVYQEIDFNDLGFENQ